MKALILTCYLRKNSNVAVSVKPRQYRLLNIIYQQTYLNFATLELTLLIFQVVADKNFTVKQVFLDHADVDCNSDWQGNGRVSVTRAESFYAQKCIFHYSIANQNILDFVRISFDANYIIYKMHIFIFSSLSVKLIKSVQNSAENMQ